MNQKSLQLQLACLSLQRQLQSHSWQLVSETKKERKSNDKADNNTNE